jgi:ubiquinone/menaquinone biosynthesis C-methylase UbiE
MSSAKIDSAEMKRTMREQWSISAIAWDHWWGVFERGAQVVNDALCDMARLSSGQRVLDLASGLGEPSFTAARRVGPRGLVVGFDLAAQMVAFASQRARERGIDNVRFVEADGERLGVGDASFDVAVSRWGLMLMPDPLLGARSVCRAVKPGARFAAAVWSTPDEVPFIALAGRIAERELGVAPPTPETPGPMRMGREGMLEECLASAGFRSIESRVLPVTMDFDSPAQFVQFQREMSGTLKRALDDKPLEVQTRLWSMLERETGRYVAADGRVRFENRVRLAVGVRA